MTNALLYCGHMTLGNNHSVGILCLGNGGTRLYCKTNKVPKLLVGYLEQIVIALEALLEKGVKQCLLFINHADCWKFLQGLYRTNGYRKQLVDKINKLREKIEVTVSWVMNESSLDHVTKNCYQLLVNGVVG